MKKLLVDIVNLNADASCLSAARWLEILSGGKKSQLFGLLNLYVKNKKKVSLGIPGATVSDIFQFNPEAIKLINNHPDIFEIILRPYAHDIGLLRTAKGFTINLEAGINTLKKTFKNYVPYFLPPEFMLTNEQIFLLSKKDIQGTFITPDRFRPEIKDRIPLIPFQVKGMFDSQINTIVFEPGITKQYLYALQNFSNKKWNKEILFSDRITIFSWRDGESPFFVPDGNQREAVWLKNEHPDIERFFLSEVLNDLDFLENDELEETNFHHYPVHSFSAWMKEFRMLGFIQQLQKIEHRIGDLSNLEKSVWLQVINSDILSAVEKDSPRIKILTSPDKKKATQYTIYRSERNFEGQEYLNILQNLNRKGVKKYLNENSQPHIQKLRSRIKFIDEQNIL